MITNLQYAAEYRGKTFVLKLDDGIVPKQASDAFVQINLLHDLGIKTVICFSSWDKDFAPICQVFQGESPDTVSIKACLNEGRNIPLVICDVGQARELARDLKADKLIYLIDAQGVMDQKGKLLSQLNVTQIADLIGKDTSRKASFQGPSKLTLIHANLAALRINRVHIVNKNDLIEELFSCTGAGTMIMEELSPYEGCREAKVEDIPYIRSLLKRFNIVPVKSIGNLVKKFVVFVADYEMYGCALCEKTVNTMTVEYFVADEFQDMDIVVELLNCILNLAKEKKCLRVVLTENNHRKLLAHVAIYNLGFDMVVSGTETQWIKHLS